MCQFTFGLCEGFDSAKVACVCRSDTREDSDIRRGDFAQTGYFTDRRSTQFHHRDLVVRTQLQQCQRDAELVVVVLWAAE